MSNKYSGFLKTTLAVIITLCTINIPLQMHRFYDLQKSSNTLLELFFIVEALSQDPNESHFNKLNQGKFKDYLPLVTLLKKSADDKHPSKIQLDMVKEQIGVIHTQQQKKLSEVQSLLGWLSATLIVTVGIILAWNLKKRSTRREEFELSEVVNFLSRADDDEVNLAEDTLRIFSDRLDSSLSFYWEWQGKALKNRAMYPFNEEELASHTNREITIGIGCIGECWLEKKSKWRPSKIKPDHYVLCIPVLASANSFIGVLEFHLPSIDNIDIEQLDQLGLRLGEALSKYNTTVELKEANTLLIGQKQALDSSAIVAETDSRGRITYVNEKFIQISKYPQDELIGQDHRILNSKHHPREFFTNLWKTIAKGNVWKGEVCNKAKDGSTYWVNTTIYPTKDEKGRIQKYTAIRFDITDRKRIEDELQGANASISAQKQALDSAAIVAETDLRGRITYVNDKFIEISGYSEKELLGQDHRILNSGYHDKDFFVQLWKTIAKGHVWTQEVKNKKKNGEYYWVDTTIYPAKDQNGKLSKFVAIRFDITSRKEAEAEIIHARDESQKAMEMKSHFLATVSHEIRTPLNGIIGFSDSLLSENLPQDNQRSINTIKQCGEILYSLINDFLDFSKIEANQLTVEQTNTNIRSILSTVSDMFDQQVSQKGIQLNYHIEKNVPKSVLSDPTRLQQVIVNLVSNAIKFTDKGEVLVSVSSEPLAESNKHQVINFKVKDTGIGIEPHNIGRLFDSFQQADKSTTRKFGGTGLGLSISKKLVQLMDGQISVTSKPGEGSTFEFTITAHVATTSTIDTSSSKQTYDISNKLRVLVVEDNKINIDLMQSYFDKISIKPKIAKNGVEACELCSESVFDLILMDLNMPILDGWSATEEIRKSQLNRCATIIALTASNLEDVKDSCMAAGFNDIALKPIRRKFLYSILETVKVNPATLPTIDENSLTENFPTKVDIILLKDLAQDFTSAYQHLTKKIHHGVKTKSIDQIKKSTHELKGVVRSFYLTKSDYLLQLLEGIDLESQLIPAVDTWLLELEQELENADNLLQQYIEKTDKDQVA